MKRLVPSCRRGISTVTSVFMLLLMFTVIVAVFLAYFQYNLAMAEQNRIEQKRSQEKIILSRIELDSQSKIKSITVNNTGSIEVRIRAVYIDGELVCDPSQAENDAYMEPSKSLLIVIPEDKTHMYTNSTRIVAATEMGVKTIDESIIQNGFEEDESYDTTKLYIGPLMLMFDSFQYQQTRKNGQPLGSWKDGWIVPDNVQYCAWKIIVKNLDDKRRDIEIDGNTSFNLAKPDSNSVWSWHLKESTLRLPFNQTATIIYLWDTPGGNAAQRIPSATAGEMRCAVFLTFFGYFLENGQRVTHYAQTIPFEACTIVKG